MNDLPMLPRAPLTPQAPDEVRSPRAANVVASARSADRADALPPSAVDSTTPEAFIRSIAPYAQRVSRATGIPSEVLIGMAANETGFGKYAHGNNLFGIKGSGPAGSFSTRTWEDYGGGRVDIQDRFRAYHSPAESMLDFTKLVMTSPRYASAMGQTSVDGFVGALKRGGYMTDPEYVQKINTISVRYADVIQDSLRRDGGPTAPVVATSARAAAPGAAMGRGVVVPDQFGVGLPPEEAHAACGPMAAIAFAQAFGRSPSPGEAMALAKQSGWTASGGMNGIANEKRLLDKMGIPSTLETKIDWEHLKAEALKRNPVIVSTPGHYFVVDGYDARSGAYHVGQSGKVYRGGAEWMTAEQIAGVAGAAHAALYTQNPFSSGPLPAPAVPAPAAPVAAAAVAAAPAPIAARPAPEPMQFNAPLPRAIVLPAPAQAEAPTVPPPVVAPPPPVEPAVSPPPRPATPSAPPPAPANPVVQAQVPPVRVVAPTAPVVPTAPVEPTARAPLPLPPLPPAQATGNAPQAPIVVIAEPATAATAADSITVTPQVAQPDPATLDRTVAFETPDGTALAAGAVAAQSSPAPRKPRVRRRRPDQEGEHDQT